MSGKEFTQQMLLQTSVTGEFEEQSRTTEKNINERFFSWMVSRKFAEQSDLSDDLNFAANEKDDEVIFNHSDRTSKYQRVLLDVEKDGEKKRRLEKRAHADAIKTASLLINKEASKQIQTDLSDNARNFRSLLRLSSAGNDLFEVLYAKVATLSRVASIIEHNFPQFSRFIIDTVNSSAFCKSLGRTPKNVRDIRAALGFIGLDGLRVLLPIMFFKEKVRFHNESLPLMANKYWSYSLRLSNTARYICDCHGIGQPDRALLPGVMRNLGSLAVYHQFEHSWMTAKQNIMIKLRESEKDEDRSIYYACKDVQPSGKSLIQIMPSLSDKITRHVVEQCDWQQLRREKNALLEDLEDIDMSKRSPMGIALKQARLSAQFNILSRHKLVKKDEIKPILWRSRLTQKQMVSIHNSALHKVDLKALIG